MQKQHDCCTVEGCGRKHKARGYCQTHYMQFKRGISELGAINTRVSTKPAECSVDGCLGGVKAKGLCKMHYQRLLRHGHVKYRDRARPVTPCRIAGCENQSYTKGLCHAHTQLEKNWKRHGVDADRYEEMLAEQKGVCKICGRPNSTKHSISGKPKRLAVDHDHESGLIRGLLCDSCNRGLGLFQDREHVLQSAIQYLRNSRISSAKENKA